MNTTELLKKCDAENADLMRKNANQKALIERLKKQTSELFEENKRLQARVKELEAYIRSLRIVGS